MRTEGWTGLTKLKDPCDYAITPNINCHVRE